MYKTTHGRLDFKSELLRSNIYMLYRSAANYVRFGYLQRPGFWYVEVDPIKIRSTVDCRFRLSRVSNELDAFKEGVAVSETPQFKAMFNRIELNKPWKECSPLYKDYNWSKDVDFYSYMNLRWAQQQILIDEVKEQRRLKSNRELGFRLGFDEIVVNVDKDGNFLKVKDSGGMHRLAVAQILKLSSIRVLVGSVHPAVIFELDRFLHICR